MSTITPVILSGGSGTRLWPLSRTLQPKQLLPLVSSRTLLQETWLRLAGMRTRLGAPVVVCNDAHRFLVAEQLRELDAGAVIMLEPAGRNTAPAVAVAALQALRADVGDPLLLVLPADHVILDEAALLSAVGAAAAAADAGRLVTFGVVPTRPETGYGYILRGAEGGAGWAVLEQFVEKPDLTTAHEYVTSGRYLWNSGMFLFSARGYLEELDQYAPRMVGACTRALEEAQVDADFIRLGASFLDCPADSIDYAVMEKTARAAVVPLHAGWSDVGSWAALHDVLDKDAEGNVLRGDVLAEACKDCYIASQGRLVAGVGLDAVIVVETEDAVLVASRAHSQDVKRIVESLEARGRDTLRHVPAGAKPSD